MINEDERNILLTAFYADLFNLVLTRDESWKRLLCGKKKIQKRKWQKLLQGLIEKGLLLEVKEEIFWKKRQICKNKLRLNEEKMELAMIASEAIKKVKGVRGVALTGSVALGNPKADDDLDFLIVTEKKRIYWTRFWCYLLAIKRGKKRSNKKEKNSWCFNMFLAEDKLLIPEEKRTLYGALQLQTMKVLWDEGEIFGKLREENKWVKDFFNEPFVESEERRDGAKTKEKRGKKNDFNLKKDKKDGVQKEYKWKKWLRRGKEKNGDFSEKLMRNCQIRYMRGKITNELLKENQIFFHPYRRKIATRQDLVEMWKKNFEDKTIKKNLIFSEEIENFLEKNANKKKGLVTGVFDLIHDGHESLLKKAEVLMKKEKGLLLIGLESDKRVKSVKGEKRPFYSQDERRIRVQNLHPETKVFILPENFGERKIREELIKKMHIDYLIINNKDKLKKEKEIEVRRIGKEVMVIKQDQDLSMTKILKKPELAKHLIFEFDKKQWGKGT